MNLLPGRMDRGVVALPGGGVNVGRTGSSEGGRPGAGGPSRAEMTKHPTTQIRMKSEHHVAKRRNPITRPATGFRPWRVFQPVQVLNHRPASIVPSVGGLHGFTIAGRTFRFRATMSRLKNYLRGLASGYALLAVNVFYTLASIRLAWSHLPEEEFGVWTISVMAAGYFAFVDLGMGPSLARLLIDHKDNRSGEAYGGMIKTGMLVFLIQGAIVLLLGSALSFFLPAWLDAPVELREDLFRLLLAQTVLVAAGFQTRVFGQLLQAHQRMDLGNIIQIVSFLVGILLLWRCLASGVGIYSLLAAQVGGWCVNVALSAWVCIRCGMLPRRGRWGRANRPQFRELFSYGTDVFLVGLGTQLIMTSHALALSRALGGKAGLEAAAVWAVATKAFTLAHQLVGRTLANAEPMFGEMHARNEAGRLKDRHRVLFRCVSAFGVWCATVFAFCNGSFLTVWMKGKVVWPELNNWLIAVWFVLLSQQAVHTLALLSMKRTSLLKKAFLAEGALFLAGGAAWFGGQGFEWLIGWSILCTTVFTFSVATFAIGALFEVGVGRLLWTRQLPGLGMLALLVPLGWGLRTFCQGIPAAAEFCVMALGLGGVGAVFFVRIVLPAEWRIKLVEYLPGALRPMLRLVGGV